MGAINWSRGLFRFWLLFALLWIAAVVALAWSSITNPYVPSYVFVEPEGDIARSTYSKQAIAAMELKRRGEFVEVEVVGAPGITYLGRKTDDLPTTMKRQAPIMIGFYTVQRASAMKANVWSAAATAIVPPLAILAFGVAVGWVLQGFRRAGRDNSAT
jgi:hypothetical protein